MIKKRLIPALLLGLTAISPTRASNHSRPAPQTSSQPATDSKSAANRNQKTVIHSSQPEDEGERVFQQNCSRCHNAPDSFSPRISGTIARHMRIRASLSQHDEEELLRFLNP